ncbi:MAG: hypothetical protein ACRD15_05675, partial [Vicinamibacterales bacterium]
APEHPKVPPSAPQLAHALSYGQESLWYPAAEAVARELATESDEPLGDQDEPADEPTDAPVPHLARCATCGVGVTFQPRPSGSSFVIIARHGIDVDAAFGIGPSGFPICPTDGHGEMQLADEQLVPASEAITQVAELTADQPAQAQLFDTAKPFNFEGAWLDIAQKQQAIDALRRTHEDDAATAKRSKKLLDEALETFGRMVNTYEARRLAKVARDVLAAAEKSLEAPGEEIASGEGESQGAAEIATSGESQAQEASA